MMAGNALVKEARTTVGLDVTLRLDPGRGGLVLRLETPALTFDVFLDTTEEEALMTFLIERCNGRKRA